MKDFVKTWNIIVSQFNSHKNKDETDIQRLWEKLLSEKFGYSSFDGEIIPQKKIPIGSNARALIPDIILCKDGEDVCAIELKTEETKLTKQYENQLFSYLKQEKLRVGILICNSIYVYSYEYYKNDNSQSRIEIPFEKDSLDGQKFVELLNHDTFSVDDFCGFVQKKIEFLENVRTISNSISIDLIKDLLIHYFEKKFSKDEIDEALKSLDIYVKSVVNEQKKVINEENNKIINQYDNEVNNKIDLSSILDSLSKGGNGPSSKLIELLKKYNILDKNSVCTVAKVNKNQRDYWANPSVDKLNQDWNLILNDINRRELHIFHIPAKSIQLSDLRVRKDKSNRINLEINYNDPNYQCHASKYNFVKWYINSIKY